MYTERQFGFTTKWFFSNFHCHVRVVLQHVIIYIHKHACVFKTQKILLLLYYLFEYAFKWTVFHLIVKLRMLCYQDESDSVTTMEKLVSNTSSGHWVLLCSSSQIEWVLYAGFKHTRCEIYSLPLNDILFLHLFVMCR